MAGGARQQLPAELRQGTPVSRFRFGQTGQRHLMVVGQLPDQVEDADLAPCSRGQG